ncbi:MFS transporter [Streptomyces hundungensis]|uniref:MFS transporter n=1 Tax=Streptomyces hundungensis TaxID=1077946 RepID=UPI0033CED51C
MTVTAIKRTDSVWHHLAFRSYLAGQSASLSGSAISTIALPTLAVVDLHASTSQVAQLSFLGQLPSFLVALPAGALADRTAKRPLMITGDLAAAVILSSVPIAAVLGTLTIGHLYGVVVLLGTAKVIHDAAAISYLPALVEPQLLQQANSRIGAVFAVADSAGSNLGAALVGLVGTARSVIADVVSYLVSAWCILRIRTPESRRTPSRRRVAADIWVGLTYVASHPTIRSLILALSACSFALGILNTYWAYYLLTDLRFSPTALGVVMGAGGIGSLAGALLAPRIARRTGPGPMIVAGFAVVAAAQIPLLLARPGRGWQTVLAAALVIQLFATAAAGTTQRSIRQIICTPHLQGRMQQTSTWVTAGARPGAALLAGALAAGLGVRTTLAFGTILLTVPVLVLWFSPIRALNQMPTPVSAQHLSKEQR